MPRTKNTVAATDQLIAEKAYERFLSRGSEHGHDLEDWLNAESELRPAKAPARKRSRILKGKAEQA